VHNKDTRHQTPDTRHHNGIDLFKIIMAIFVVAIHTHPLKNYEFGFFGKIYGMFLSSAVPFFFISSGFLLFEKIDDLVNLERVWKYLIKIIKLYCIWTLIYMPLTVYDYIINDHSILMDLLLFIRGLFFIGEHYNSWILWYLLSLIYSIFLIGILLKFNVSLIKIYTISILLFTFGNIMTFLVTNINDLYGILKTIVKLYNYAFGNGRLFTGMFYVSAGIFIVKNKVNINLAICLCIMLSGILCNIFAPPLLSSMSVAIYSIKLFIIVLKIQLRNNIMYKKLRESSTIFYFLHLICWSVYTIIFLNKPNHDGMDSFVIVVIGCSVLSIILISLKRYKTFSWIKKIL
jgi:hypothetical protein